MLNREKRPHYSGLIAARYAGEVAVGFRLASPRAELVGPSYVLILIDHEIVLGPGDGVRLVLDCPDGGEDRRLDQAAGPGAHEALTVPGKPADHRTPQELALVARDEPLGVSHVGKRKKRALAIERRFGFSRRRAAAAATRWRSSPGRLARLRSAPAGPRADLRHVGRLADALLEGRRDGVPHRLDAVRLHQSARMRRVLQLRADHEYGKRAGADQMPQRQRRT